MKKIVTLVACLLVARAASAQTFCVRHGANGSGDGSDWTNAFPDLPSSLQRGATYYVAAGAYGPWDLADPESGSTLITIKKATVTDHGTTTGWSDSYASGVAAIPTVVIEYGYYTIDGQTGGGPGSWESGFGMQVGDPAAPDIAISIRGTNWGAPPLPTHITAEHLDIPGSNTGNVAAMSAGVTSNEAPGVGSNNLTVRYCYIHDMAPGGDPIAVFWANNATIEYNDLARLQFDPTHHAEAILSKGNNQLTIRYNRFEDIDAGTAVIAIFHNTNGQAVNHDVHVYGNIVSCTSSIPSVGMGFVGQLSNSDPVVNARIYNNTIVNCTGNSGANWGVFIDNGSGNQVYNNLWANAWAVVYLDATGNGNVEDYNTESNCNDHASSLVGPNDKIYASGDPFVNLAGNDFRLSGPTDPGLPLNAPYNVDMLGHTANDNGGWDRGALQYTADLGNSAAADGGNLPRGDVSAGCACNAVGSDGGEGGVTLLLVFVCWFASRCRRRAA